MDELPSSVDGVCCDSWMCVWDIFLKVISLSKSSLLSVFCWDVGCCCMLSVCCVRCLVCMVCCFEVGRKLFEYLARLLMGRKK